jgi:tetratricopeptide (TPR) repeat protein
MMNLFLRRGLEAYQQGRPADALDWCDRAGTADALMVQRLRGLSLLALGQGSEALQALHAALALSPQPTAERAELLNDCALVHLAQDQPQQAVPLLQEALPLAKSTAQGLLLGNLGNAYRRSGALPQAIACLQQAVEADAQAWGSWNNLALALRDSGAADKAIAAFARAMALVTAQQPLSGPLCAEAAVMAVHWAFCLMEAQRWAEARQVLTQAHAWAPDDQAVWNATGLLRLRTDDPAGAVEAFTRALEVSSPAEGETVQRGLLLSGLGAALFDCGAYAQALEACDRARALAPQAPEVRLNRAAALLVHGQMAAGWQDLEYRWQTPTFLRRYHSPEAPLWDGAAHAGETLLLRWEQAFGDALMCARLLPLVAKAFGGRVVVESHPALSRLLASVPGVAAVVPFAAKDKAHGWPVHHWQAGMISVARLLGLTTTAALPKAACLPPPLPQDVQRFAVPPGPGPAIGLSWAGRAQPRNRSLPFDALWQAVQRGARGQAVRWVCVQADQRRAEAAAFVKDGCLWMPPQPKDFADSAALVSQLDLVITIDSAVLHLAGAQGVPTAGLLLAGADWRYGLPVAAGEQATECWYPQAYLFRQPALSDWPGALDALADRLAEMCP